MVMVETKLQIYDYFLNRKKIFSHLGGGATAEKEGSITPLYFSLMLTAKPPQGTMRSFSTLLLFTFLLLMLYACGL